MASARSGTADRALLSSGFSMALQEGKNEHQTVCLSYFEENGT